MIFVTVGTQLPFPRLVNFMDAYAQTHAEDVVAQTGAKGDWPNLRASPSLAMAEMEAMHRDARVIVGHAGIGTVLAARAARRPLIVVPRRSALGEHRNDHQLDTARALEAQAGVWVAWDVSQVSALLDTDLVLQDPSDNPLHDSLVRTLRDFAFA